ncbi:hypothetical protein [Mesorhizobium sp.]|uniref:hypothetical protein n=1 Tax=Mesorhizobium sp. TaxID=1871066 RepID=UPI00120B933C|nr:hypothetical protein [Mesorhizobium sp.]TIS46182.1 MAG: hypothetical protein E5W96_27775 [Mesorhizobium sp.]
MKLKIADLIHDMSCAGIHPETCRGRINHYTAEHLLTPVRQTNTTPSVYSLRDSALAIVFAAVQDICYKPDRDLLWEVGLVAHCHLDRCLAGIAAGEAWTLIVHTYRDLGVRAHARLVGPGETHPVMPYSLARGSLIVPLNEMLKPVLRRLNPPKGAN